MKSSKCYTTPLVKVNLFEIKDVICTSEQYDGIITETGNWSPIKNGGEGF